jgi:hypothetical protein
LEKKKNNKGNSMLKSGVYKVEEIDHKTVIILYTLFSKYYDNSDFSVFEKDFYKKSDVIILKDIDDKIYGFSTIEIININIENSEKIVLFSGDTIIDKNYWAKNDLHIVFGKYLLKLLEIYKENEIFWLLISKGYRTYKYLPLYFKNFFPDYKKESLTNIENKILDTVLENKFGKYYDKENKIVRFYDKKDRLKKEFAVVEKEKLNDKYIEFFIKKNPFYYNGEELCCICQICFDNFTNAAKRVLKI